jgi:hypothetical protein
MLRYVASIGHTDSPTGRLGGNVTGDNRNSNLSIEIYIGAATIVLSTAAWLCGSSKLAVVALVIGGVSFGLVLSGRVRG